MNTTKILFHLLLLTVQFNEFCVESFIKCNELLLHSNLIIIRMKFPDAECSLLSFPNPFEYKSEYYNNTQVKVQSVIFW